MKNLLKFIALDKRRAFLVFIVAQLFFINFSALGDRSKVDLTGYKVIWRDEFDGDKVDATKWGSPQQKRQGSSLWHKRNVSVKDGAAVLKIRKTQDLTYRYESACLRTTKSYAKADRLFEFAYGYVEVRCKLPKYVRSDYWFAAWMMIGNVNNNTNTREGCEVDIMETFRVYDRGSIPHTFHWGGYGVSHNVAGYTATPNLDLLDGNWHTFGCLWEKEGMTFTIDGYVTWSTKLQGLGREGKNKHKSQGVPQVSGYIKLSVEAAPWVGPNSDWEKVMPEEDEVLIDWVRVWQKN